MKRRDFLIGLLGMPAIPAVAKDLHSAEQVVKYEMMLKQLPSPVGGEMMASARLLPFAPQVTGAWYPVDFHWAPSPRQIRNHIAKSKTARLASRFRG